MSGHEQSDGSEQAEQDLAGDLQESTPNSSGPERAAGGMGISSERVGHTGPHQEATDGVKDTSAAPPEGDPPPEQAPGGEEQLAEGIAPAAGYPSLDPRSSDKPYET
jgi:hypothetical protein